MTKSCNIFLCLLVSTVTVYSVSAQSADADHKIFIVFNQPKFAAGDTAFFRGHLMSGDLKAVAGKKIVNLKLFTPDNEEVLYNRVVFQNGSCANQLVLPGQLSPGVYSLVVYADRSSSLYQIPFLIAGEKEIDISGITQNVQNSTKPFRVIIDTDKQQYGVREKITVSVSVMDASGMPVQTDNAISVVQEELFKNTPWHDTFQETVLNATAGGSYTTKETPYYFKGSLLNSFTKSDSVLITFYLNNNDFIYGQYADRNGDFEFPLFKEFGKEKIYYSVSRKGVRLAERIILHERFIDKTEQWQNSEKKNPDQYFKLSTSRNKVAGSYNYYLAESSDNTDETDDWMDTDFEIGMDNFEPFMDMKEVLINIVQTVKYVARKEGDGVRVFMKESAMYARYDPLFIINGTMTDDTQYFLGLDPDKIEKIGVLRSSKNLARFGELGKNGIVLVKTRDATVDLGGIRTLSITGINKSVDFHSPGYDNNTNAKVPDLRSTLYWNPKLISDKNGIITFSFYTGDATGTFTIKINGRSENGFFSAEENFEVVRN